MIAPPCQSLIGGGRSYFLPPSLSVCCPASIGDGKAAAVAPGQGGKLTDSTGPHHAAFCFPSFFRNAASRSRTRGITFLPNSANSQL